MLTGNRQPPDFSSNDRPQLAVVDLNAARERREAEAFYAYVAAKERADETLLVEDGLAAGRAWRAFLDTFISPTQREVFEQCDRVVGIERRR